MDSTNHASLGKTRSSTQKSKASKPYSKHSEKISTGVDPVSCGESYSGQDIRTQASKSKPSLKSDVKITADMTSASASPLHRSLLES